MKRVLAVLLVAFTMEAAGARKITSVTHVRAVKRGNAIYTTATGDVSSGGWTSPRLTQAKVKSGVLTYQFTATPPPPDAYVTQALREVQADAVYRGKAKVTKVRVIAAGGSVVVDLNAASSNTH